MDELSGEPAWAAHAAAMLAAAMLVTVIVAFGSVGALILGVLFASAGCADDDEP